MRCGILWSLILYLIGCGCSAPGRLNGPSATTAIRLPAPYVRISNTDSNLVELQIAIREFLPSRSRQPVVWLTAVSHLGESNYYAALQTHLDAQTLVLFEGVGAVDEEGTAQVDRTAASAGTQAAEAVPAGANRGSLQSTMAASLGLAFQLEAIDYRRPNFRNSDLSISQLRQLIAQQTGPSGQANASESFEDLLALMEGNSWFDSLLQLGLRFLGANPKLQAFGRLALIDLLGQLQGDPSRLQGLPPELRQLLEVLLQRRNQKVIADLKSQLPRVGRHGSIAIFFGTGHMPDLEKRLCGELRYRPAGEVWFTAFSVNLAKTGVSGPERSFIDGLIERQIQQAEVPPGPRQKGY